LLWHQRQRHVHVHLHQKFTDLWYRYISKYFDICFAARKKEKYRGGKLQDTVRHQKAPAFSLVSPQLQTRSLRTSPSSSPYLRLIWHAPMVLTTYQKSKQPKLKPLLNSRGPSQTNSPVSHCPTQNHAVRSKASYLRDCL
jgi:hypothetical protein